MIPINSMPLVSILGANLGTTFSGWIVRPLASNGSRRDRSSLFGPCLPIVLFIFLSAVQYGEVVLKAVID